VGECPHLSGARGVGRFLQDGFEFELDASNKALHKSVGGFWM